jgi:hypothetical protein
MPIAIGAPAREVPAADVQGPHALVFYKVTCSVTELAAEPLRRFGEAYPGSVVGVGQDPQDQVDAFARRLGWRFPQVTDLPPYEVSDAYEVRSAPTVVVVDDDGRIADVAESWDRDAFNRASATLARLLGHEPVAVSDPGDGLPPFKPG